MPRPLAELRDEADKEIKSLRELRQRYNDAPEGSSERAEARAAFAEARTRFDAASDEYDAARESHDIDGYLEEVEERHRKNAEAADNDGTGGRRRRKKKRSTERRSRRRQPGRDDSELVFDDAGDDGDDESGAMRFKQREQRGRLAVEGWCIRAAGLEPEQRHRRAMQALNMRNGKMLRYASLENKSFNRLQAEFRNCHPDKLGVVMHQMLEQRNLSTLQLSKAGVVTSHGFVVALEVAQLANSGMLQVAEIIRTPNGSEFPWPGVNDTETEGEIIGAGQDNGDSVDPTFNHRKMRAHKSHAKPVKVEYEVLEDWSAQGRFSDWLAETLGQRLGRHRNRVYTVGSGSGEPWGIVPAAPIGRTTAAPNALIGDDFMRLIYSVDESYRLGAGFMMHDNIFLEVQLLKDNQGQFIHTPGLQEGARDRIRGYPRHNNTHMDSALASENDVALFGQLSRYKIREVNQHRLKRFDELYGEQDVIAFDDYIRHDGMLVNAGTPPVKKLRMAS